MKPLRPLSLPAIWNMSFGFLGIQFGFGLQLANMSAIYAKLGADASKIPLLWLAGPMTGLIVQPIIGAMSDRTWNRFGRRRPYFLAGALLASVALFFMPDAPALWVAAGMLWILDTSINVSMEPFRAFVADKLPEQQRTLGFVMQSFFIGIGAAVANALPTIFERFGVHGNAANGVPIAVQYAFKLGAAAFLLAVLYTVITTPEFPPEDMEEFLRKKREHKRYRLDPKYVGGGALLGLLFGISRGALVDGALGLWQPLGGALIGAVVGGVLSGPEVSTALREMPVMMKRLAVVQFFTWLGLFCMWLHFSNAVPVIFGSSDSNSDLFKRGAEWAGVCFALKDGVTFLAAFGLMAAARRMDRRHVHALCLVLGGLGLLAVGFIHGEDQRYWLLGALALGGVAWASILSMPYAILAGALPTARVGVYMGIFNFFIVLPEILAALFFGGLVKNFLHGNLVHAVMAGGVFMLIAAVLTVVWVKEAPPATA